MQISIVVPVYERQEACTAALRSIVAQEAAWQEIIVVDDHSPNPYELPDDLVARGDITVLRHDVNRGAGPARDTGIAAARSDWIALLDSDDVWLPDKLARQVAYAQRDQSANCNPLVCYAMGFVQAHQQAGRSRALIPIASVDPADFASACWFMPGSTILFSKKLWDATGRYDSNLRRLEDLDWYLRMSLSGGSLKVAPGIGAHIEVGARPTPETIDAACGYVEDKWLSESAIRTLSARAKRNLRAYLALERASAHFYSGRYIATARYLGQSWLSRPRFRLHLKHWWQRA